MAAQIRRENKTMANWIKRNDDHFDWLECSECGYGSEGEVEKATHFCPICGARMDGGMSNNAMIIGKFSYLLNVLDPKALITVFEITGEGKQRIVYHNARVYSLYNLMNDDCGDRHGDYNIVGITLGITTSILIKKGE